MYFVQSMCILRRRQWHPTPVLLPGKSHGRRSLEGCSTWGRWGSGTTEQLHFHFSLSCIREGNSNPLQCSCLENPRGGGAWWAAVYGVAQSWTQLKWLSSICILIVYMYQFQSPSSSHSTPFFPPVWACAQSCPILCSSMDCSPPGSSVLGIFLARMLQWVTISSSRGSSQPRDPTLGSCVSCVGRRILYH